MSRLHKIALSAAILTVLSVPTLALSNTYVAPENPFHGFYVGAGLNAIDLNDKMTITSPNTPSSTYQGGQHNVGGTLFAGYGIPIQQFYLGAELFYRYAPTNDKSQTITFTSGSSNSFDKVKTDRDGGLAIKAGYRVAPNTLLYLLLGAEYSRIKVTNQSTDSSAHNNAFSKNKLGFMPGIGIATFLTNHLLLNLQYTYTSYSSFSYTPADNSSTTKIEPKRNIVTIGLAYQFCNSELSDTDKTYYGYMSSDPTYNLFNGFYLGAGLDAVSLNSDYTVTDPVANLKLHGDDPLFGANIFGGYSHVFSQFYLGGELFARYLPSDDHHYGADGQLNVKKVKESNMFGADIRAGYQVTPSNLLYLLVGIESTQFKATVNNVNGTRITFKKTEQAFLPGLGLETAITPHLHLRGQYTYASYSSFSHTDAATGDVFKIKPAQGTFTLALLWQFS